MQAGAIIPDTAASAPLDLPEKKFCTQSRTDLLPLGGIPYSCLLKGPDCIVLCNSFLFLSMIFLLLLDDTLPCFPLTFSFIILLNL